MIHLNDSFQNYSRVTYTEGVHTAGRHNSWTECIFDAGWEGRYALENVGGSSNRFIGCSFKRAPEKLVLAESMWFEDCIFEEAGEDAIFVKGSGYVSVIGHNVGSANPTSVIRSLGHKPGAHADGFQWTIGTNVYVRGVKFDLSHVAAEEAGRTGTNSCIAIEPTFSPLRKGTFVKNVLDGGNYPLYSVPAPNRPEHGIARELRIRGNWIGEHRFRVPFNVHGHDIADLLLDNHMDQARQTP